MAAPELPSRELIMGVAAINVLDNSDRRLAGAVEARFEPITWCLQPWTGITYEGKQSYLIAAGLVLTKQTRSGFRFSIGWAPSYYHRGGGKDLGGELEFYSFGEIGWMFPNQHVISLRFGHISNAGFKSYNPGTELLELGYSFPLRW
ncbi:MAG TPA: acyloxyacyl hydrolase [Rariglobus sp.]|jgi:hypothetical protein|nr:acyloxyacyl hydrolase [Rariglobus sp.]